MSKILTGKPAPFKKTITVTVKIKCIADTQEILDDMTSIVIYMIECAGDEIHYDDCEGNEEYGDIDVKVVGKSKLPAAFR